MVGGLLRHLLALVAGEPFDRCLGEGLRTLYPLNEPPGAEVMRRSVAYELPLLSAYDPVAAP